MLEKSYRELHDGLGTVAIDLNLSKRRLDRLQEKAGFYSTSVDSMISDAVDNYLVSSEKDAPKQTEASDQPQMESLKKENRLLKALIEILPKPKRTSRKKPKKHESSPLQMYLLLRTSSGKFISWTQPGVQQLSTEQKLKGLDEIDLMAMIYDLKKANLDEDKNYLEALQRELARREAMKPNVDET